MRAYIAKSYGWSLDDIRKLKQSELNGYFKLARQIESQNALRQLNIVDYPKMKSEDRRKFYKALRKEAYPNEKPKVVKLSDAGKYLNGK
jgi:hypothetical protein